MEEWRQGGVVGGGRKDLHYRVIILLIVVNKEKYCVTEYKVFLRDSLIPK